jgi:MFS family permease
VRRPRFYYGWVIAVSAAISAAFVLGSAQFALSAFLVPMQQELGWSRTAIFGALAVRYLVAGVLAPVIGPITDQVRGPRIWFPVAAVLLGGALAAVPLMDHPLWFLFWYGGVGAVGAAMLTLNMWEAVLLKWFSRRRTRALVIGAVGEASGPTIFPLLVTGLIAGAGWRGAWVWFGALTLAVLLPLTLALRTRPEQVGQRLDGDPAPAPAPSAPAQGGPVRAESLTRREAMGHWSFWALAATFTLSGIAITGFQAQWIPYLVDESFSPTIAAGAISVYGVSNIGSRMLWGALAARFPLRGLMAVHAVLAFGGIVALLTAVASVPALFGWAAYQGLVLGSFFSLHTFIAADYFGRAHIGAIRGAMTMPAAVARAVGPVALSALRDARGSYLAAFALVLGVWAAKFALTLSARRPR